MIQGKNSRTVVGQKVVSNQWPKIIVVGAVASDRPGAAADIPSSHVGERVRIDAHSGSEIVAEVIPDNDRLCPANKDRGRIIEATPGTIRQRIAIRIVLNAAVRDTELPLVDFDHVEIVGNTFDRRGATTKPDIRVVDARSCCSIQNDACPIAGPRHVCEPRAVGVERATGSKPSIGDARKDNPLPRLTLGIEARNSSVEFDAGLLQFHDHTRIDGESPGRPRLLRVEREGDTGAIFRSRLCECYDVGANIDGIDLRAFRDTLTDDIHATRKNTRIRDRYVCRAEREVRRQR